jgi:hypothetical protein
MDTNVALDVLDRVQVASPCPVRWDSMRGDNRKRFCDQCRLNVYNLSAMTREEAAELVLRAEGRFCAGFYRRADGTILTRDCPVGLRAARAAAASALRRVAAAIALVAGAVLVGAGRTPGWRLRNVQPFSRVCEWLSPSAPPFMAGKVSWTAGSMIRPLPAPPPNVPGKRGGSR